MARNGGRGTLPQSEGIASPHVQRRGIDTPEALYDNGWSSGTRSEKGNAQNELSEARRVCSEVSSRLSTDSFWKFLWTLHTERLSSTSFKQQLISHVPAFPTFVIPPPQLQQSTYITMVSFTAFTQPLISKSSTLPHCPQAPTTTTEANRISLVSH
jgi:hypothetical protein